MTNRPALARRDPRLIRLFQRARGQHSLFRADEALSLGFTPSEIEGRLARREWVALAPGVLASGSLAVTPRTRLRAGQMYLPESWATHESAAALWGLRGYALETPVRLARHDPAPIRLDATFVSRVDHESQVAAVDGIRVTTIAETIVDLAGLRYMSVRRLLTLAADACRRLPVTPRGIQSRIRPGHRGAARVREMLELLGLDDPSRSSSEAMMQAALRRVHGFGPPALNAKVVVGQGRVVEFDAAWIDLRVAVEFDGRPFHSLGIDRARDQQRDREASADGWVVWRVDNEIVDHPDSFIEEVELRLHMARQRRLAE